MDRVQGLDALVVARLQWVNHRGTASGRPVSIVSPLRCGLISFRKKGNVWIIIVFFFFIFEFLKFKSVVVTASTVVRSPNHLPNSSTTSLLSLSPMISVFAPLSVTSQMKVMMEQRPHLRNWLSDIGRSEVFGVRPHQELRCLLARCGRRCSLAWFSEMGKSH